MKVTMMTTMKTMAMTTKEVLACLPSWADPPVAHFQLFNHYDNDDDDSDNGDDDYDDDDDDDDDDVDDDDDDIVKGTTPVFYLRGSKGFAGNQFLLGFLQR